MNFDLQDLILIETIEQNGSFSGAAERLYRTRSAITQHIKKLEDQLGFILFNRAQYRPTLTAEGQLFLERARPLLRNFERLKGEVHSIKEGWESEFVIAIDDVLAIENIFFLIESFRKVNPHVTIRILREVLNGCWDALIEKRAQLVVGASGEVPLNLMCEQRVLGSLEFVFAVAKEHPLTHYPPPISPDDLIPFPTIIVSDTSQTIEKRNTGITSHQPKVIVPTMDAKIKAQVQGLGVGYLPRTRIKSLLESGDLIELELVRQVKKKGYFNIAWHTNSESKALAWFLEELKSKETLERLLGNHLL